MTINSSYSDYSNQSNYSIQSDGNTQSKESSLDQLFREERDKILSDPNLSPQEKGRALAQLLNKTTSSFVKKFSETPPSNPEYQKLMHDYEAFRNDAHELMQMDIVKDAMKDEIVAIKPEKGELTPIKRDEDKPKGLMDLARGK